MIILKYKIFCWESNIIILYLMNKNNYPYNKILVFVPSFFF